MATIAPTLMAGAAVVEVAPAPGTAPTTLPEKTRFETLTLTAEGGSPTDEATPASNAAAAGEPAEPERLPCSVAPSAATSPGGACTLVVADTPPPPA